MMGLALGIGIALGWCAFLRYGDLEPPHSTGHNPHTQGAGGLSAETVTQMRAVSQSAMALTCHWPQQKGSCCWCHRLGKIEHDLAARWVPYEDQPEHIKQALSLMAYQLGVDRVNCSLKRCWGAWSKHDTQCAARAALNSKWAHQTPGRADTVAALFLKER